MRQVTTNETKTSDGPYTTYTKTKTINRKHKSKIITTTQQYGPRDGRNTFLGETKVVEKKKFK